MKTKIQKWGNSLAVRLPKSITDQKDLQAGSGVSVTLKNNQIIVEQVEDEMSLASLLSKMSVDTIHNETDWSTVTDNEVW